MEARKADRLRDPEVRAKAKLAARKSLSQKFREKPTRKAAIDLFCQQCMGGPGNSPWKRLIRECTATNCPLHPWRPYK